MNIVTAGTEHIDPAAEREVQYDGETEDHVRALRAGICSRLYCVRYAIRQGWGLSNWDAKYLDAELRNALGTVHFFASGQNGGPDD